MADNTVINLGAGGDTIASDDVSGVKYQRIKVVIGVEGTDGGNVSGSNPLPVVQTSGRLSWGQSLAVAAGATATPVNLPAVAAGYRIKGAICHGTADGYFAVQVNGITLVSGRTRSTAPMLQIQLPNGVATSAGANVAVRVTNESGSTADYEITLLGE